MTLFLLLIDEDQLIAYICQKNVLLIQKFHKIWPQMDHSQQLSAFQDSKFRLKHQGQPAGGSHSKSS